MSSLDNHCSYAGRRVPVHFSTMDSLLWISPDSPECLTEIVIKYFFSWRWFSHAFDGGLAFESVSAALIERIDHLGKRRAIRFGLIKNGCAEWRRSFVECCLATINAMYPPASGQKGRYLTVQGLSQFLFRRGFFEESCSHSQRL